MKTIKLVLLALLLLLSALWLAADTPWPQPFGYFPFRAAFMQFSGVVAMGAMSAAMLLAVRPRWLEPHLGGLDKMYRLHKWLGVTALVASVLHWWWAQGTKWMVGWGWLTRPARKPRPPGVDVGGLESWLSGQRGLAESVGEWAFYGAAVLMVLALVKRFPYHRFTQTHRWIAVAYLVLAYHAVVLTKFTYWRQPIGWVMAVLLAAGVVAAGLSLLRRIGAGRKTQGRIESIVDYPALRVLETRIRVSPDGWVGHRAGQFAFVTSDPKEGAHPYTIASAWDAESPGITFITKALGDHTARLRDRLKVGMPVTVEGPYGCFDFEDPQPRQIWIGAGIGITPFIARMKQLSVARPPQPVDLFHTTREYDPGAIDKLTTDALASGVRLHLLVDSVDGYLDVDRICAAVPEWATASVWFCGPPAFGHALRRGLVARGLPSARFHQELFEMR